MAANRMTPLQLTLSAAILIGCMGAAIAQQSLQQGPNQGQERPTPTATDPHAQLSFHTLDDDVQQVSVDQIWRIRAASTRDEPAGSIVVDYGWTRVFVKDSLENVVGKLRSYRDVIKFTSPSGEPIFIPRDKITGITRPIANQHHQKSKSIVVAREGQQQVQESRETIIDAMK
jgi:hypothetical protein